MKKTPEQIHYNMSKIRSKDSVIEVKLRKELWSRGLRYRKNFKGAEGRPDIAFVGPKVAVFCDSEFWHGYDWENRKDDIKTNKEFWHRKILRNMERDKEVNSILEDEGWTVIRFWGRQINENVSGCADAVERAVRKNV
jgi:DNA mismatch endonuclease (patch repair protein)